jgi:hypothetical protein
MTALFTKTKKQNDPCVHQWMERKCAPTHRGILFSLKGGNSVICNNTDKPGSHQWYAWSHLSVGSKKAELIEKESRSGYQGLEGGRLGRCWSKDIKFQLNMRSKSKRSVVVTEVDNNELSTWNCWVEFKYFLTKINKYMRQHICYWTWLGTLQCIHISKNVVYYIHTHIISICK